MINRLRHFWLRLPIGTKTGLLFLILVLSMIVTAAFNIHTTRLSLDGVGRILSDISRCSNAQEAMKDEEAAFRAYMKDRTRENETRLGQTAVHTRACIDLLPFDYDRIGPERYARTWSIRNSYTGYEQSREEASAASLEAEGAVRKLYQVYDRQEFLMNYLQALTQITVEEGSAQYELRVPLLNSLPYILLLMMMILMVITLGMTQILSRLIVTPIRSIAEESRQMAAGNIDVPDIRVSNEDELGELVSTFNRMKKSTRDSIATLEENQRLSEKLHKEEMERVNMEKRLETARLDLLQSQINPHFLFNTLNTIAGMAELEEADTTDRMIRSLSNIFRYNLHTTEQFISLTQELKVTEDYMYLQKMRFGDRLRYRTVLGADVNTDTILVPVFILQPLVENAIIHGVTQKEQGGVVSVAVYMDGGAVRIDVEDTGAGMPEREFRKLQDSLRAGTAGPAGIGVGNIYKRIHSIYEKGEFRMSSEEGVGTQVTLVLPQDEKIIQDEYDDTDRG